MVLIKTHGWGSRKWKYLCCCYTQALAATTEGTKLALIQCHTYRNFFRYLHCYSFFTHFAFLLKHAWYEFRESTDPWNLQYWYTAQTSYVVKRFTLCQSVISGGCRISNSRGILVLQKVSVLVEEQLPAFVSISKHSNFSLNLASNITDCVDWLLNWYL